MINFASFFAHLDTFNLGEHAAHFSQAISNGMSPQRHGDIHQWLAALNALPEIKAETLDFKKGVSVGKASEIEPEQQGAIEDKLRALIPWRKGPFDVFGIDINTEWRSDWKWDRVLPHISPLKGRKILDVGCGSGYHCWRMHGEGAEWVLGIDPSPRFVVQFEMIKHFTGERPIDVVPLGIEHLPPKLNYFDTTFSMGVLYHRTSPIDHIKELRNTLKPGGELVLETLVIDGKIGEILVPEDRYAKMRNVWFIPSVASLIQWLAKCGFEDARCVDLNKTSIEEQRSTDWMPSHSLKDFLNPDNSDLTFEGLPAPLRAVVVAKRTG